MRNIIFLILVFVVSMATYSQTGGRQSASQIRRAQREAARREAEQKEIAAKGGVPFETKQSVLFEDFSLDEYTMSEWDRNYTHIDNQQRYSASGAMIEQVEFSYSDDRNELLTKLTRDVERRLKNRVVYKHNPQGHLSQESLVDNKGKIVSTYEYSYDNTGNRIGRVIKNRAGNKLAETTYTFNPQGKMLTSATKDFSETVISSTRYTYDSMGNLIRQEVMNNEGVITSRITSTWRDGHEILMEMAAGDGTLRMRISYEYGENGELLRKTIENLQGESTQIMQYEYIFRNIKS